MKSDLKLAVYNIAVLGANGGIGIETVKMALRYGHNVTAILERHQN